MRKPSISAAILLATVVLAAVAAWAETTVLPEGRVFTVINYKRAQGRARPTSVTVISGDSRRSKIVIPPYRRCDTTIPAGFVLKMRHVGPDTTLATDGEIVGISEEIPLEVLHPCYKLVLF